MLLYSRTLLFIHSILNVIVCIYQTQTSSPSLSFPSPHWQPQVVLNVKNLQMRGEDWPLRSKWKSNTPKTHCMYKQRHLKETEALPNVQDSEVKVYIPHSLTGRDSAPFSSVYSLRRKASPSVTRMHWAGQPDTRKHSLVVPRFAGQKSIPTGV